MGKVLLTIQHDGKVFQPPVKEGVQIEWERTGSPGKLTFTTIGVSGGSFTEGDPVCFYYDGKEVFMGYVFTKKHDRENNIEVTCYDQIRYLKNKYTYVFENKTATQIIKALCDDFNLVTGTMNDTKYSIPAIAEENKSALDITLNVLEETLLNTGDMFVLYDDFGKLNLKNVENMMSTTWIVKDTAENFDYSSSIDDETYNSVVLYYKPEDELVYLYTASSPSTIKQWGTLRYFEEVKTPTIGQSKADALLKLYNKKTRELKVTGAFGDISVRGGTLIPVNLDFGDILANNFMLVEKVVHKFDKDHHTMDLTLEGAWADKKSNSESGDTANSGSVSGSTSWGETTDDIVSATIHSGKKYTCTIKSQDFGTGGSFRFSGDYYLKIGYFSDQSYREIKRDFENDMNITINCDAYTYITVDAYYSNYHSCKKVKEVGDWTEVTDSSGTHYQCYVKSDSSITIDIAFDFVGTLKEIF